MKIAIYLSCFCTVAAGILSCSVALDFDALQEGQEETQDSDGDDNTCESDAECDDDIDCTSDRCNADGRCVHDPNNSACPGFEVCKRGQGCVDIGRECLLDTDCDDEISCTVDYCGNDGKCSNLADDDLCIDPDNLCIGAMTCDTESGCIGGFEKRCDQIDGPACFNNICNPATGECDLTEPRPGSDDDGDGYCDDLAAFGGDDCEDADATVYPGADEVCNGVDNNCDELADGVAAIPVTVIAEATRLSSPSIAFGAGRYAAAWQEGTGDDAAVKIRLLGEGECAASADCDDSTLLSASEVMDITALGGAGRRGEMPAIGFADGRFYVVFVATAADETPHVVQTSFEVTSDNTVSLDDSAERLSDDEVKTINAVSVDAASDTVVAAWSAEFTDDTYGLQLKPDGAERFTGARNGAVVSNLDLACEDDCVVVYDKVTDGDLEVYEGLIQLGSTSSFAEGWPVQVSRSSGESGDPSSAPSVTWLDDNNWAVSFTDVAALADDDTAFEVDSDIRGSLGDGVVDLLTDSVGQHGQSEIAFDGDRLSVLFVNSVQGALTLQAALFDSAFSRVSDQRTELAQLESGAFETGPLLWTGDHLAAVWVSTPESGDASLKFLSFETCTPEE